VLAGAYFSIYRNPISFVLMFFPLIINFHFLPSCLKTSCPNAVVLLRFCYQYKRKWKYDMYCVCDRLPRDEETFITKGSYQSYSRSAVHITPCLLCYSENSLPAVFTTACCLFLSSARWSPPPHPFSTAFLFDSFDRLLTYTRDCQSLFTIQSTVSFSPLPCEIWTTC
jgi:hypothetical protein